MATFTINDSSQIWSITDLQTYYLTDITPVTVNNYVIGVEGLNREGRAVQYTVMGGFYSDGSTVEGDISRIYLKIEGALSFYATGLDVPFSSYSDVGSASFLEEATKDDDKITANTTVGGYWSAGKGDDTINPGSGDDTIDGGRGTDNLYIDSTLADASFSNGNYGRITVTSSDGTDTFSSIELLRFDDQVIFVINAKSNGRATFGDRMSTYTENLMQGSYSADKMNGRSGDDTLFGDFGNDTLKGSSGHDLLFGNSNDDHLEGGSGRDTLNGDSGNDTVLGDGGSDSIDGGSGEDSLNGGGGRDTLVGDIGDDTLIGANGADSLNGGSGNDLLNGGLGNDTLSTGDGEDTVTGHRGDDLLLGGGQADIFTFRKGHGNDTISDFTVGEDQIQIGLGASRFGQLEITRQGDDVLIAFSDVTILIEDANVADIAQADNFLF